MSGGAGRSLFPSAAKPLVGRGLLALACATACRGSSGCRACLAGCARVWARRSFCRWAGAVRPPLTLERTGRGTGPRAAFVSASPRAGLGTRLVLRRSSSSRPTATVGGAGVG
eukprot:4184800-Alexandrium_andersonii.AAC.1